MMGEGLEEKVLKKLSSLLLWLERVMIWWVRGRTLKIGGAKEKLGNDFFS